MNKSRIIYILLSLFFLSSCYDQKQLSELILRHYIDKNEKLIRNYHIKDGLAVWESSVLPGDENYRRLVLIQLDFYQSKRGLTNAFVPERFPFTSENIFSEERDFQVFRKLRSSGLVTDSLLSRQLDVLCHAFMDGQIETDQFRELIEYEMLPVQKFSGFKVSIDGYRYSEVEVDSIRRISREPSVFKKIFDSRRTIGKQIAADILQMVNLRNEYAQSCGYKNYYELALELQDQDKTTVDSLLKLMEERTNELYFDAKKVIDKSIAKRLGIQPEEVKFWHFVDERYQFFPVSFSPRLDGLFSKKNVISTASAYFDSIGLPVQDVIERSDLQNRKDKSVVSGIVNIDFRNDIRMLACIRNDTHSMREMMHLCGAAAYYKSIADSIPYLLKDPHFIISEGVSVFFEDLPVNYEWMKNMVHIDPADEWLYQIIAQHSFQVDKIFKCRTLLVRALFEKAIYEDPDQDLSQLWWALNKKYMGLEPPGEVYSYDWACTYFATMLSCNSQNFLFAEMFAAQLRHTIEEKNLSLEKNASLGEFLVKHVFSYGNVLSWEKLIEEATGEKLSPEYLIEYMQERHVIMKPGASKVHAM